MIVVTWIGQYSKCIFVLDFEMNLWLSPIYEVSEEKKSKIKSTFIETDEIVIVQLMTMLLLI